MNAEDVWRELQEVACEEARMRASLGRARGMLREARARLAAAHAKLIGG